MKDLSIIILNNRSLDLISPCLLSLTSISERAISFEVIVVDNLSTNTKLSEFRKLFPRFCFIPNHGDLRYSNGNNLGAAYADGKYFLFLNPEVIVSEESLLTMLEQAKAGDDDSIISCPNFKENDKKIIPNEVITSRTTFGRWTGVLTRFLNFSSTHKNSFSFSDWASRSAILMSKSCFASASSTLSGVHVSDSHYSSSHKDKLEETYGSYFWF